MEKARESQSKMNEAELKDLGKQLTQSSPEAIRIALGVGLKTPTREILNDAITQKRVTL